MNLPSGATETLARYISGKLAAIANCEKSGNKEWQEIHRQHVIRAVSIHMPSGSGIDCGTTLDFDRSNPEKLVFQTSFHHMTEHGFYDGWTDHVVICRASLLFGVVLQISGRNRDCIKEYLYDRFFGTLTDAVDRKRVEQQ